MPSFFFFFFFNDTATTEIYTLSLHDALPICARTLSKSCWNGDSAFAPPSTKDSTCRNKKFFRLPRAGAGRTVVRSEEHTSELQSPCNLVCRLLLEKKKKEKQQTSA